MTDKRANRFIERYVKKVTCGTNLSNHAKMKKRGFMLMGTNKKLSIWWKVSTEKQFMAVHHFCMKKYCGDRFGGWWYAIAQLATRRYAESFCKHFYQCPDLFWYYFSPFVMLDHKNRNVRQAAAEGWK